MKFIELGGYVSFFFLSNFLQKKVKLLENLEKTIPKNIVDTANFFS